MADEAPVTPTKVPFSLTNHPKISAAIFAGAVTNLLIGIAKMKYGLDLSGMDQDLTLVVMGAVGYIVPGDA
jgi:hypothetical protein